ncbi:MAG: hypothetical protein UH241_07975 [Acutalibacteraceae bacterium]|nr:hypothetical protein [Acutalibacteraceae bacterium]
MEDVRESILTKLREYTKNTKFVTVIVAIGLIGIVLILLSDLVKPKTSEEKQSDTQIKYVSLDEYENRLEQGLAEIISSINGAGKTRVLLTMESTVEQVYATNKNLSQDNSTNMDNSNSSSDKDIQAETTYITVELSDGTEETVLVKEIQPKVRGVLVVCAGGDDSIVKGKIIDAVTKALDISSSKVSVAGLSQ